MAQMQMMQAAAQQQDSQGKGAADGYPNGAAQGAPSGQPFLYNALFNNDPAAFASQGSHQVEEPRAMLQGSKKIRNTKTKSKMAEPLAVPYQIKNTFIDVQERSTSSPLG